jgi:hypothetical protein
MEDVPIVETNDERVTDYGRYFLCVLVEKLDLVLQDAGLEFAQRRTICSLFADNLAAFVDSGWMESDAGRLWPILAFAERGPDSDLSVGALKRLFVPSLESYHGEGGAEGAVAYHFDRDPEIREWLTFTAGD